MAINPAFLIAAPMLQDYFVDNATGAAMSAGVVTCYQDNSRTTLKNWYYQSGTPGNYTYIPLDNPMTLSAVGTIVDVNGNDTIPFFYPRSENDQNVIQTYYITVVDSNGQNQFVRQNFPFIATSGTGTEIPTLNNLVANNVFYHNVNSLFVGNSLNVLLAPSQHDGFTAANNNDVRFVKNIIGANDTITFTAFGLNVDPFLPEPTPEYYLNMNCVAGGSGETNKAVQFPVSLHIKTLENVAATLTIWAQNVGGSSNNTLTLNIVQYLGSSSILNPVFTPIGSGTITVSNAWTKFMIPFIFPGTSGVTPPTTGDDALLLQIGYPLNATCNINFTKPSIYLSKAIPSNEFSTYDEIDTIINSPRTGDIRVGINSFAPFGWVLMADGTVGNGSSLATRANIDTWNLFNLIWNGVGPTYAQMYDSTHTPVSYGATPLADWNANNQLSIPKQLGNAIASKGLSALGVTTWSLGQSGGSETSSGLVSHNHLFGGPGAAAAAGADIPVYTVSADGTGQNHTTTTGTGATVSLMQPTTFYNVFMKL